jgi:hypothetical protein
MELSHLSQQQLYNVNGILIVEGQFKHLTVQQSNLHVRRLQNEHLNVGFQCFC